MDRHSYVYKVGTLEKLRKFKKLTKLVRNLQSLSGIGKITGKAHFTDKLCNERDINDQ